METGFFKWVWRFNALVIAGVVTCAAVAIVWDMTRDLRREWLPTRTTDTLAIAPTEAGTAPVAAPQTVARRYFGRPGTQGSGSIFAMPLYVEQKYENRGISKSSSGNIVNYRIVDMQAATNRWLFPATGVERLVLEAQPMILNTSQGNQRRIGYLLSVVEADTNGDARLSRRDLHHALFHRPALGAAHKTDRRRHVTFDCQTAINDTDRCLFRHGRWHPCGPFRVSRRDAVVRAGDQDAGLNQGFSKVISTPQMSTP